VVSSRPAIEPALATALRVTFTGSTMPALTRSTYCPVAAFRPSPHSAPRSRSTTTYPSCPAFWAIQRSGSTSALVTMATPVASSPVRPRLPASVGTSWASATPPPGTMPSSTAALVDEMASSIRCRFSRSSGSVAAPTLITAIPPESRATRSLSFFLSHSLSAASISLRICSTRLATSSERPPPSTIVVVSLAMTTRRARPSCEIWVFSSLRPISSVITSPPVRIAMSSSIRLRRSPKPGAFTATPVKVPRSLLTTSVASDSPSTSSAMISSGLPD
jgi:hypothetical protein